MNKSPEKLEWTYKPAPRKIPTGDDSIAKVVDLALSLLRICYPAVSKLEPHIQGRLITAPDQIQAVEEDELPGIEQKDKPAREVLLYSLLKESGIPEDTLKRGLYRTSVGGDFYYPFFPQELDNNRSQIYFKKDYLAAFWGDDQIRHFQTALSLGIKLISANLYLIPEPMDIEGDAKSRVRTLMDRYVDKQFLASLETEFAEETSAHKVEIPGRGFATHLELTRAVIRSLVNCDIPTYSPRFVAVGGKVCLVLPHQNLNSAELVMGTVFNTEIFSYLAEPVVEKFFQAYRATYGIDDLSKEVLKIFLGADFHPMVTRAAYNLHLLKLKDQRATFDAYRSSRLPLIIVQAKGKKINTEVYPE